MKISKSILLILGILLILAGGVFFLQGINVITVRSFMRGDPNWAWYGAGMVVVGVVLVAVSNRLRIPKIVKSLATLALSILGILVFLAGLVWFLQGINVLPGSVMTGQIQWAINGGIAMIAGAGLVFAVNRKRFRRRR